MANTLTRLGLRYSIPGYPYQPARPGYWTSVPVVVEEPIYGQSPGGTFIDSTGKVVHVPVTVIVGYRRVTTMRAEYIPPVAEIPGVPTTTVENPPRGWTSFARSIGAIPAAGTATWKVLHGTNGAAVGLAPWAAPESGYGHITHGLVFLDGYARLLRTGAVLGTFAEGDTFTQDVDAVNVVFKKNGVELATEANVYPASTPLHLHGVLYSVGDSLTDPALATAAPPLANTGSGSLVALQFAVLGGDAAISQGAVLAPQFTVSGYGGGVEPAPISYGGVAAPQFALAGLGTVTHTGEGAVTAPQFAMLASEEAYGEGRVTAPQFTALGVAWPTGMAYALDVILFDVPMLARSERIVDARDTFTVDAPMSAEQSTTVDARDAFTFDVVFSFTGDQLADARDVFWFDVPMLVASDSTGDAWAVNLDGFGSTTYSGYPFNSFANIGGRYFGAAASGIHELDGDTDGGAPIRASVDFGDVDFGNSFKKTVAECYLGMSSTGHLFIKILAEGQEFIYRTLGYSEHMQQQRVTLGKGLRPNYAGLQLFNDDGADFALDSVEFVPVTMTRRI